MEIIKYTSIKIYLIPKKESKIINDTKLTKRTIETLLNEIFSLNKEENEERVSEFSDIFSLKHD